MYFLVMKGARSSFMTHVARHVLAEFEPAIVEIPLDDGSARIDAFAPERERLPRACGFGGGVLDRRAMRGSVGRLTAAAGSGGQAEPFTHVIAAGAEIVSREGMAHEAIGRRRRQLQGEASVFRAVRRPGREYLGAKNLAAQGAGDRGKVGPGCHGASRSESGSDS